MSTKDEVDLIQKSMEDVGVTSLVPVEVDLKYVVNI